MQELVYDRKIPNNELEMSPEHKRVWNWIGSDKDVLEVAPHTGYFSALLQRNGCKVTGIEINDVALRQAEPYLEKSILGNIEETDVWNRLENKKFDVVLFMHVLEHLVNPEKVLKKAQSYLKDGGFIIVCLPNVSNWLERLNMMKGNFTYTESGIMDKTHLKFYNYFTAKELLEKNGYKILEYYGGGWKVKFGILKNVSLMNGFNRRFNYYVHKILSPNITDRTTAFKALKK